MRMRCCVCLLVTLEWPAVSTVTTIEAIRQGESLINARPYSYFCYELATVAACAATAAVGGASPSVAVGLGCCCCCSSAASAAAAGFCSRSPRASAPGCSPSSLARTWRAAEGVQPTAHAPSSFERAPF